MPAKTKAPITFRIKRSAKTKQFRCVVIAGNGEPILTGEPCKNRRDVQKMIASVYEAFASGVVTVIDETEPVDERLLRKVDEAIAELMTKKGAKKKPRLNNSKLNRNWP